MSDVTISINGDEVASRVPTRLERGTTADFSALIAGIVASQVTLYTRRGRFGELTSAIMSEGSGGLWTYSLSTGGLAGGLLSWSIRASGEGEQLVDDGLIHLVAGFANVEITNAPDQFSFSDVTGADLSTLYTSDDITVAGLDSPADISVSGGTYSINGGSYTSVDGTVENGDTVSVRATSSGSYSTTVNVVLTIGGVSDTYSVRTGANPASDDVPDAFSFTDVTNASLSTLYTSNTITIAGIDIPSAISISGGTYSKNGGSYTSSPGTVDNGDTVAVRVTSSGSFSTAANAILTVGGVSDTYSVTTLASDSTPDAFSFTDVSGAELSTDTTSAAVTVAGINTAAAISIVGGTYQINGGSFVSSVGTVVSGDTVAVKGTSSGSYSTDVDVVLTIGGVSDTFTITTKADPGTPAPSLDFSDANNSQNIGVGFV